MAAASSQCRTRSGCTACSGREAVLAALLAAATGRCSAAAERVDEDESDRCKLEEEF